MSSPNTIKKAPKSKLIKSIKINSDNKELRIQEIIKIEKNWVYNFKIECRIYMSKAVLKIQFKHHNFNQQSNK